MSVIHNKKYTHYTQFITTDNKQGIAAEEDSSAERESRLDLLFQNKKKKKGLNIRL